MNLDHVSCIHAYVSCVLICVCCKKYNMFTHAVVSHSQNSSWRLHSLYVLVFFLRALSLSISLMDVSVTHF